jgi:hypothetical protein
MPTLSQAAAEGKDVLSKFANMAVLNSLVHNLRMLITDLQQDEEATVVLSKIKRYIERTLDEPQLLDAAWHRQKASRLLDRLGTVGERYRNHAALNGALADWRTLLDDIGRDQQLNQFAMAVRQWTEDLTYADDKGQRHLNTAVLTQLRDVFVPLLIEQLHYIPIPIIQGSNARYDWTFENIVFSAYDILPEHIFLDTETHTNFKPLSDYQHETIEKTLESGGRSTLAPSLAPPSESDARPAYRRRYHKFGGAFTRRSKKVGGRRVRGYWPPREKLAPGTTALSSATNLPGPVMTPDAHFRTTGQLVIRAYNIQIAMKDVKFHIRRKSFPRVDQSGLLDVNTKGVRGCKVIIRLDLASDNVPNNMFTGGAVEVRLAPLALRIHDSKHDFLLNTLVKLMSGAIRKRIEVAIVDNLSQGLKRILESVNDVVRRSPNIAQSIRGMFGGGGVGGGGGGGGVGAAGALSQVGRVAADAMRPGSSTTLQDVKQQARELGGEIAAGGGQALGQ